MQFRPFRLPTLLLLRWGAEALALLIVLITVAAIRPVRAGPAGRHSRRGV